MPKTKLESIVFSAVTAWIMVYIMTLYNIVLATGTFINATFLAAFQGMWLEFIIIFLCAYFISSRVAKHFAFRVVKPGDRPIFIILAIQNLYGDLPGGPGQHSGRMARLRLYQPVSPQLPCDLLPEFHHGPAYAAVPCRPRSPVAVSAAVPPGKRCPGKADRKGTAESRHCGIKYPACFGSISF